MKTELIFSQGKITKEFNGDYNLILTIPKEEKHNLEVLNQLLHDDKLKVCAIDYKRNKRSLNANKLAWKLIEELAIAIGCSNDEVYLDMLESYGITSIIACNEEALEDTKKILKYCKEFGRRKQNGKPLVYLKSFLGSSEFNTAQMSRFLDGIIKTCKDYGVSVINPKDLELIKQQWNGDKT